MHITFPHPDCLQANQGRQRAVLSLILGSLLAGLGLMTIIQSAQVNPLRPDATALSGEHDRRPLGYSIGCLLSLLGLWGLYRSLWQPNLFCLQIDRQRGLIRVEYHSLLRHGQTNYYRLEEARAIAVSPAQDAAETPHLGPEEPKPEQHITLLLNSGEFLSLTLPAHISSTKIQAIAQFLRHSLGS